MGYETWQNILYHNPYDNILQIRDSNTNKNVLTLSTENDISYGYFKLKFVLGNTSNEPIIIPNIKLIDDISFNWIAIKLNKGQGENGIVDINVNKDIDTCGSIKGWGTIQNAIVDEFEQIKYFK